MYDPNLESHAALGNIGTLERTIDCSFSCEDPLVTMLKEVRSKKAKAQDFIGSLSSSVEFFRDLSIQKNYGYSLNLDIGYFYSSVIEALINSIEHGSDFCKNGQVRLQIFLGTAGIAVFVDDPGKGYDPISAGIPGEHRGHGIFSMRESELFGHDRYTLGTEQLEAGFRTILLYHKPE